MTYATFDAALLELHTNPSAYQTESALKQLAREVSVYAEGEVIVFYGQDAHDLAPEKRTSAPSTKKCCRYRPCMCT